MTTLRHAGRNVPVTRKTGRTLVIDRQRAPQLEEAARGAIQALLATFPDGDAAGLSRALVQEAVRSDAVRRGQHEAATWAAAQARRVEGQHISESATAAAQRLFSGRAA